MSSLNFDVVDLMARDFADLDAAQRRAVIDAMVLSALADDRIADDEVHALEGAVLGAPAFGRQSPEDLRSLFVDAVSRCDSSPRDSFVRGIANSVGRGSQLAKQIFKLAAAVTCCDGEVNGLESDLLVDLGRELGFSDEGFNALLDEVLREVLKRQAEA